jgi:hypothetical protein
VLVPLYREAHMLPSLGAALRRLAFQIMVGGTILSAPWFYVLASVEFGAGEFLARPESLFGWPATRLDGA